MTANDFIFFNRPEYFKQLAHMALTAKRGDRILLASMTFNPTEPLIAELMQALCGAAARGASVHLLIDAHTFMAGEDRIMPGPLWFHTTLPAKLAEPFHSERAVLQALESSGGHYTITNLPEKRFQNPYAGRSHIKTAIVNDRIFIGGCNLQKPKHVDIMTAWHDPKSADWVYRLMTKMAAAGSNERTFGGHDQTLQLSETQQILIDAGMPNQSAIYAQALDFIDSAQERIFFTCQYFPGGKTGQHLRAAYKRGVDVRIVFSHPSSHGQKWLGHYLYNARERLRLPAELFADERPHRAPLMHAKVIATEQGAIIGSHNYVSQGVWFGTAEIALVNRDPAFAQKLIQKIGSEL